MTEIEIRFLGQLLKYPELINQTNIPIEYLSETGQTIFEKIIELSQEDIKLDILILAARLPEVNPGLIAKLGDCITDANFEYYQDSIRASRYKMRLLELAERISTDIITNDIVIVLQNIQDAIDDLADAGEPYKITKIDSELTPAITEIEKRYKIRGETPGLKTGIDRLDTLLAGDPRQRLFYIGARPGEGKTALMLNIISRQAIRQHKKIGVVNLESSTKEMLLRMLSEVGNIPGEKIKTGMLAEKDFGKLIDSAEALKDLNIYFYDEPNISLQRLISKMRYMVQTKKIEIIFIDYLQLLTYKKAGLKRHEEIAYISRMLKEQARRLNVPVVVLAQLTRDSESRRPRLGDFSESSQIEKDADVAILIYHRYKEALNKITNKYYASINEWWLCVEKNRDGRTGSVRVNFQKEYVRFIEWRED